MNATSHGGTLANPVLTPQPREAWLERLLEDRLTLGGTKVRELLRNGAILPEEFTRPVVAEVLRAYRVADT